MKRANPSIPQEASATPPLATGLPPGDAARQAVARGASEWVSDLCDWKILNEQAARLNRNLIQYAASLGALLGIGAGSGGVFALADAVSAAKSETFPVAITTFVTVSGIVIILFAVCLVVLLVDTFRDRSRVERAADEHLRRLIYVKPDQFLSVSG